MNRAFHFVLNLSVPLFVVGLGFDSPRADGAIITPVGVVASSDIGGLRAASSTIDGVTGGELDPAITNATVTEANIGTWKHNSVTSGHWLTNNTEQARITFDLGSVQTIAGLWLWNNIENYAEGTAAVELDSGFRGVKTVTAWVTDSAGNVAVAGGGDVQIAGISQFNRSPSTYTPLPAGTPQTDYFWTPTYYAFTSPVTAQYIKLDITDSWNPGAPGPGPGGLGGDSASYTGFAEIRFQTFDGSQVPEPGSFALLALGAIGLIGFAWRRRK